MRHQVQKDFRGIFVRIPQHQKEYPVYIMSTRKIISSYDVDFDERFSSKLAFTSQPYEEAMAMHVAVLYIYSAINPKEKTGDIITFTHLKRGIYYLKS